MANDKKYKDVPRHKAVFEYEDAFKKDFKQTVKAGLKEMFTLMNKIVTSDIQSSTNK